MDRGAVTEQARGTFIGWRRKKALADENARRAREKAAHSDLEKIALIVTQAKRGARFAKLHVWRQLQADFGLTPKAAAALVQHSRLRRAFRARVGNHSGIEARRIARAILLEADARTSMDGTPEGAFAKKLARWAETETPVLRS